MPKHSDTLEQIRLLNGGLAWKKVEALLKSLGAEVYEGSGSTVTLALGGGSSPLIARTQERNADEGW